MNNHEKLIRALTTLRNASLSIDPNDPRSTFIEYNLLFLGDKFSVIYAMELQHCLREYFGLDLTDDDLLTLIPQVCYDLGMRCEGMILLSQAGKASSPSDFRIVLHDR